MENHVSVMVKSWKSLGILLGPRCMNLEYRLRGISWAIGKVNTGPQEHHGPWVRSIQVHGSIMGRGMVNTGPGE